VTAEFGPWRWIAMVWTRDLQSLMLMFLYREFSNKISTAMNLREQHPGLDWNGRGLVDVGVIESKSL
jgi:hypothetical protein